MWLSVVMKFVTSKQGMIVVGIMIVFSLIAGAKWKISGLESDLEQARSETATMQIRNKLCQADIQGLQVSVETQNKKVSDLERTNRELTIASSQSAREEITSPVDIEIEVKGGSGPDAFDIFMEERFGD